MRWTVLSLNSQILAVHAALMRTRNGTGQILYFGGDEHDRGQHDSGRIDHSRLFDCVTNNIINPGSPPATDLFCCGHALIGGGRLLTAGGTMAFPDEVPGIHAPHFPGLRDAWIFNAMTGAWTGAASMNTEPGRSTGGGRWYPTLVTLPNGRVLAMSGHPDENDTRHTNNSPEVYSPVSNAWGFATGADPAHEMDYYPRLHVLPNGEVFCSTRIYSGRNQSFNPVMRSWRDICAQPTDDIYYGFASTSVLLPLLPSQGYRPHVLLCGGRQPQLLNLGAGTPAWAPTSTRALGAPNPPRRRNLSAILLPTGEVFVCGGVSADNSSDASAVLGAELYNPATNAWTILPSATVIRNYHSVALLMPDGRVWTAGGNRNAQQSFSTPGVDNRELRIEIFEPWYYGRADRPQIISLPSVADCGQAFDVRTPQAESISSVVLLRAGSSTHAFDSDQRYVGLRFIRADSGRLTVTAPPNPNIAPPGEYLLFVTDRLGVPSEGRFIEIRPVVNSLVVMHLDNPEGDNHAYFRLGRNLDAEGNVSAGWTNPAQIPGWFGWENQGGDIASVDLNGNGRPDLFVFHIDNPGGENHGYYRVGKDLDSNGNVTGGWSNPIMVPGWFGAEDQGAGIAIGYVNNNGRPDLIVFHVDNPGGENHGYYRMGCDLDVSGNVTAGWTDIKPVPGWFGAEDQGAGIALADINGNGRPDLIVFHLDNPGGDNHGYYRIGWNLDFSGNVTGGWSPVIPVPGWFGWENQGAGIALADINGNGRLDLIIFHIDNPGGENRGYYRVGRDLDASGNATGGWTEPIPIPGWFGAENQGAGITIVRSLLS